MSQLTESTPTLPTSGPSVSPVLGLTDRAIEKVRHFAKTMPGAEAKALRVFVQGGGCSGFQYGFTFDDPLETDVTIETGGITVLVDPQSRTYLEGSTVDYVEDMRGAGFTVINPKAKGGCGCGQSFEV